MKTMDLCLNGSWQCFKMETFQGSLKTCSMYAVTLSESSHWKVLTADEKVRGPHLSLPELPQKHGMLTQDVLRTKLSRNDCYGTWSPSRQCYQGPQTERKLKGVHLCAPLSGPKQFCKSTTEAVKNALKSNRFWCVNSDCEILQILHFFAWPKST